MLAARDQENLVHGHQQAAASKPLNQGTRGAPPKTPGNSYPKTPLKVPLHDENAPTGFGQKSVLATKGKGLENMTIGGKKGANYDKNAFVTPRGPQTRAPLGMKTTNAKAKAFQTPAGPSADKAPEKTQLRPTSARPHKLKVAHAETIKLEIHGDELGPLDGREVEYCPPRPKDLPYESDIFTEGEPNFDILKDPNQRRAWQRSFYIQADSNGVSKRERQLEESLAKALKETDQKILKAVEEDEFTIGDLPELSMGKKRQENKPAKPAEQQIRKVGGEYSRGPGTITSRRAASALAIAPKAAPAPVKTSKPLTAPYNPSFLVRSKKTPLPTNAASTMRHNAVVAASKSTIGYRKGRTASSVLNMSYELPARPAVGLARSHSNLSMGSDSTITPARLAKKQDDSEDWRKLAFLGAFDTDDDDDDLEPGLRGALPDCLRNDEDTEEFVMTLGNV